MNQYTKRFTECSLADLKKLIRFFGSLPRKTENQFLLYQAMQVAFLRASEIPASEKRAPIIENRFNCYACKAPIVSQGEQVIECSVCSYPHMANGQAYAIN
tara:strand:+ start:331 stop:633 length:303 start_codon:yes stop_codon:yes gene_type:complete